MTVLSREAELVFGKVRRQLPPMAMPQGSYAHANIAKSPWVYHAIPGIMNL